MSSVTTSDARSTISASISRRLAALAPIAVHMRAGLEPGVHHHRRRRIGGRRPRCRRRAPPPRPTPPRGPARRAPCASAAQKASSLSRDRAPNTASSDEHADRLERERLRARLPAGADERDLAGVRPRHLFARDRARGAGADLAEHVGLDDRQQALARNRAARERRPRRRISAHSGAARAIAAAHHVEPAVAKRPARARHDIGLARVRAPRRRRAAPARAIGMSRNSATSFSFR